MRIAVSTETNAGLDAPVAGHFGRCPFFTLVDLEGEHIEAVEVVANPYFLAHEPGQVPEFVHSPKRQRHVDRRDGGTGSGLLRAVWHPASDGRGGYRAPNTGPFPAR